jgi:hypothetical protein
VALAKSFEEDDAGGDRDVERFHGAGGGEGDDEIAALAGQIVQAFTFTAKNDAHGRSVIGFCVALVGVLVEADEPVARFLQLLHRLRKIGDFRDRQVRQGAGGSARNRVREAGRAPLGDDHAVGAGGQRSSNNGAEIVRVLDTVKQDDQTFLTVARAGVGGGEDVFESCRGPCGGHRNDTLMIFRTGKAIDLGALLKAQGNVPFPRELDDLFDARVFATARDDDAIERVARFQGFADGVDSSQAVHEGDSLQARMLSWKQGREQIEHKRGLIQRGAEFKDAGARRFDAHGEGKRRRFVEKQNHAV